LGQIIIILGKNAIISYFPLTLIDPNLLDLTCYYSEVLTIFEVIRRRKFTQWETNTAENCFRQSGGGSIFSWSRDPPGLAFL